jgi:endonuclease III
MVVVVALEGGKAMPRIPLAQVVDRLRSHYGRPAPPAVTDPWLQILWENVAYLADDDRRRDAFQRLQQRVGTRPDEILAADDDALLEVAGFGIMPENQVAKLRRCATIALEEFDGDLRPVLKLPLPKAKKALGKFPAVGEPGAEKVLLFARAAPVLALDSNGLRVLVRLGFADEAKNYATTYRLVRAAVADEVKSDYAWLIAAHQLLRRHGQELCRRTKPRCGECPLAPDCEYHQSGAAE